MKNRDKCNSPGRNLQDYLGTKFRTVLSEDWDEPLIPFLRAADTGVFVPIVGEGETKRETCDRAAREAEDLLLLLLGESRVKVEYCQEINSPLKRLVGEKAFLVGVRAVLKTALAQPVKIHDLARYLSVQVWSPEEYPVFGHLSNEFLESLIKSLLGAGRNLGFSETFSTALWFVDEFKKYSRYDDLNFVGLEIGLVMPVLVAVDRYVGALKNQDAETQDALAPWLRVFSVILPLGRLKEKPDTWLFYRP